MSSSAQTQQQCRIFKRTVTGDEKWFVYNDGERKKALVKTKGSIVNHSQNRLASKKDVVNMIASEQNCVLGGTPSKLDLSSDTDILQLEQLMSEINKWRPELANQKGVVFRQNNARS